MMTVTYRRTFVFLICTSFLFFAVCTTNARAQSGDTGYVPPDSTELSKDTVKAADKEGSQPTSSSEGVTKEVIEKAKAGDEQAKKQIDDAIKKNEGSVTYTTPDGEVVTCTKVGGGSISCAAGKEAVSDLAQGDAGSQSKGILGGLQEQAKKMYDNVFKPVNNNPVADPTNKIGDFFYDEKNALTQINDSSINQGQLLDGILNESPAAGELSKFETSAQSTANTFQGKPIDIVNVKPAGFNEPLSWAGQRTAADLLNSTGGFTPRENTFSSFSNKPVDFGNFNKFISGPVGPFDLASVRPEAYSSQLFRPQFDSPTLFQNVQSTRVSSLTSDDLGFGKGDLGGAFGDLAIDPRFQQGAELSLGLNQAGDLVVLENGIPIETNSAIPLDVFSENDLGIADAARFSIDGDIETQLAEISRQGVFGNALPAFTTPADGGVVSPGLGIGSANQAVIPQNFNEVVQAVRELRIADALRGTTSLAGAFFNGSVLQEITRNTARLGESFIQDTAQRFGFTNGFAPLGEGVLPQGSGASVDLTLDDETGLFIDQNGRQYAVVLGENGQGAFIPLDFDGANGTTVGDVINQAVETGDEGLGFVPDTEGRGQLTIESSLLKDAGITTSSAQLSNRFTGTVTSEYEQMQTFFEEETTPDAATSVEVVSTSDFSNEAQQRLKAAFDKQDAAIARDIALNQALPSKEALSRVSTFSPDRVLLPPPQPETIRQSDAQTIDVAEVKGGTQVPAAGPDGNVNTQVPQPTVVAQRNPIEVPTKTVLDQIADFVSRIPKEFGILSSATAAPIKEGPAAQSPAVIPPVPDEKPSNAPVDAPDPGKNPITEARNLAKQGNVLGALDVLGFKPTEADKKFIADLSSRTTTISDTSGGKRKPIELNSIEDFFNVVRLAQNGDIIAAAEGTEGSGYERAYLDKYGRVYAFVRGSDGKIYSKISHQYMSSNAKNSYENRDKLTTGVIHADDLKDDIGYQPTSVVRLVDEGKKRVDRNSGGQFHFGQNVVCDSPETCVTAQAASVFDHLSHIQDGHSGADNDNSIGIEHACSNACTEATPQGMEQSKVVWNVLRDLMGIERVVPHAYSDNRGGSGGTEGLTLAQTLLSDPSWAQPEETQRFLADSSGGGTINSIQEALSQFANWINPAQGTVPLGTRFSLGAGDIGADTSRSVDGIVAVSKTAPLPAQNPLHAAERAGDLETQIALAPTSSAVPVVTTSVAEGSRASEVSSSPSPLIIGITPSESLQGARGSDVVLLTDVSGGALGEVRGDIDVARGVPVENIVPVSNEGERLFAQNAGDIVDTTTLPYRLFGLSDAASNLTINDTGVPPLPTRNPAAMDLRDIVASLGENLPRGISLPSVRTGTAGSVDGNTPVLVTDRSNGETVGASSGGDVLVEGSSPTIPTQEVPTIEEGPVVSYLDGISRAGKALQDAVGLGGGEPTVSEAPAVSYLEGFSRAGQALQTALGQGDGHSPATGPLLDPVVPPEPIIAQSPVTATPNQRVAELAQRAGIGATNKDGVLVDGQGRELTVRDSERVVVPGGDVAAVQQNINGKILNGIKDPNAPRNYPIMDERIKDWQDAGRTVIDLREEFKGHYPKSSDSQVTTMFLHGSKMNGGQLINHCRSTSECYSVVIGDGRGGTIDGAFYVLADDNERTNHAYGASYISRGYGVAGADADLPGEVVNATNEQLISSKVAAALDVHKYGLVWTTHGMSSDFSLGGRHSCEGGCNTVAAIFGDKNLSYTQSVEELVARGADGSEIVVAAYTKPPVIPEGYVLDIPPRSGADRFWSGVNRIAGTSGDAVRYVTGTGGTGAPSLLSTIGQLIGGGASPVETTPITQTPPQSPEGPQNPAVPSAPTLPPVVRGIACTPGAVIAGDTSARVSVRYACSNSTSSRGEGFATGGATSGEVAARIQNTTGDVTRFGVTCTARDANNRLIESAAARCSVTTLHPIVTLVAQSGSIVAPGSTVSIRWAAAGLGVVNNGDQCILFAPVNTEIERGSRVGSATVENLTRSTQFKLACATAAGKVAVGQITIRVEGGDETPLETEVPTGLFAGSSITSTVDRPNQPVNTTPTGATNTAPVQGGEQAPPGQFYGTDDQGNQILLCDPSVGLDQFTNCLLNR